MLGKYFLLVQVSQVLFKEFGSFYTGMRLLCSFIFWCLNGFLIGFEFAKRRFSERFGQTNLPVWALLLSGSCGGVRDGFLSIMPPVGSLNNVAL